MAKKKAARKVTKSEFLRKALGRNPDLDNDQIIRKWIKAGHAGVISKPLYYKVRGELGIKTEWAWVRDPAAEVDQSLLARAEETGRSNDDLVEAVEDVLPEILMVFNRSEDKHPVIEFDLQGRQIDERSR